MAGEADRVANWFDDAFSPKPAALVCTTISTLAVAVTSATNVYRADRTSNDVNFSLAARGDFDGQTFVFTNVKGSNRTYVGAPGNNLLDPANGLVSRYEIAGLGSSITVQWDDPDGIWVIQ